MQWSDRLGRRIKLRDLHVLMAVAEWGSMAKAAEHLSISHPVISKTISELEHTLGVRLLDRSARGVEPTAYGLALLKCGTAVFDEMRQGLNQIEVLSHGASGDLRIGCTEAMAAGLLSTIAERFSEQCPGARLHVIHANTAAPQFGELRERNVALLLGTMPRPFVEEDLSAEILFEDRFVVVAGLESHWVRRRRLALDDIVNETWVLAPPESVPGRLVTELFTAAGLTPPRGAMVSLSIHLTTRLVATGRFLALLPLSILRFGAERLALKVLPVKLPAHGVAVGIVTVKNRTTSPLAQRFIACARAIAAPASE